MIRLFMGALLTCSILLCPSFGRTVGTGTLGAQAAPVSTAGEPNDITSARALHACVATTVSDARKSDPAFDPRKIPVGATLDVCGTPQTFARGDTIWGLGSSIIRTRRHAPQTAGKPVWQQLGTAKSEASYWKTQAQAAREKLRQVPERIRNARAAGEKHLAQVAASRDRLAAATWTLGTALGIVILAAIGGAIALYRYLSGNAKSWKERAEGAEVALAQERSTNEKTAAELRQKANATVQPERPPPAEDVAALKQKLAEALQLIEQLRTGLEESSGKVVDLPLIGETHRFMFHPKVHNGTDQHEWRGFPITITRHEQKLLDGEHVTDIMAVAPWHIASDPGGSEQSPTKQALNRAVLVYRLHHATGTLEQKKESILRQMHSEDDAYQWLKSRNFNWTRDASMSKQDWLKGTGVVIEKVPAGAEMAA